MAMLSNSPQEESGPGTIVGANVRLVGTLQDKNNINIHGVIEGEVISEREIDVAKGAKVKGPMTGLIIRVAGEIKGDVQAKEKLEILPTGKIVGSINSKDLVINSGAIFVGKCTMPGPDTELPTEKTEPPAEESKK